MAQIEMQPYKRVTSARQKVSKPGIFAKFERSDIFPGIISFLLSRAVMIASISPFGVAFFASAFKKEKTWIMFILVALGCISTGMGVMSIRYAVAMVLFTTYKMFLDKQGNRGVVSNCIMLGLSLFLSGIFFLINEVFLPFDILIVLLESLIGGFMVAIFSEVVPLIDKTAMRGYVSGEQMLCLVVMGGIILAGMYNIAKIGVVSVSEIVCVLVILMTAFQRGAGVGTAAGLASGLICGISNPGILSILGIYAFCGFVAGCLRPIGKFGVAIGFLLASVIMGLYANLFMSGVIGIFNICIGIVIFLFMPKKVHGYIGEMISDKYAGFGENAHIKRLQQIIQSRLNNVSTSFAKLATTFDQLSVRRVKNYNADIAMLFDDAAEKVCRTCSVCVHCWEKDFDTTYQALFKLPERLEKKGYVDVLDVPEHFRKRCVRIDDLVSTINKLFEIYRINSIWSAETEQSRNLLSQQYNGFSSVINALKNEISEELSFDSKYESRIASMMQKKHIRPERISVLETLNGHVEVEITLMDSKDMQHEGDLLLIVSEVLSQPMRVVDAPLQDGEYKLIFEQQFNFSISSGVSTLKKKGQSLCGDGHLAMSLPENRYVVAISDGMGSGNDAANESSVAISLIEQLLQAGFDRSATAKLINSALVIKAGTESFATIDFALIDLISGVAEFVKIGSAASYIKRKDRVDKISCSTLPAGIFAAVDMELYSKKLYDQDMIVMVSDGVADAQRGDDWIYNFLCEVESDDPEEVSELMLKEAVICKKGVVDDDMTVIVAKAWKK